MLSLKKLEKNTRSCWISIIEYGTELMDMGIAIKVIPILLFIDDCKDVEKE